MTLVDYCASKFAAFGFDESIRLELKAQNITGVHTTCVCPYYINTGFFLFSFFFASLSLYNQECLKASSQCF